VFKDVKYDIIISNKKQGIDLKRVFCEKDNLEIEKYKIRLIYQGGEIKDDTYLDIYNFTNHPQVQVQANKNEEFL
jgi:hypothetical protein